MGSSNRFQFVQMRAAAIAKTRRHLKQQRSNPLSGRLLAEQQHPSARTIQLRQGALQQFVLQLAMLAGKAVKGRTGKDAQFRVRQCRDAIGAFFAERATDEIGRKDNADNLLASVRRADGKLEYAADDIGDDQRLIAFPDDGLAALHRLFAAQTTQCLQFLRREAGAYCLIADNAFGAVFHAGSVAIYSADRNRCSL